MTDKAQQLAQLEAELRVEIARERHRMDLRERQAQLALNVLTRISAILLLGATVLLGRL